MVHADPTDHYAEGAVDVKVIVKERMILKKRSLFNMKPETEEV